MTLHFVNDPLSVLPDSAEEVCIAASASDSDGLVRTLSTYSACVSFRRLGLPWFDYLVHCFPVEGDISVCRASTHRGSIHRGLQAVSSVSGNSLREELTDGSSDNTLWLAGHGSGSRLA